MKRGQGFARRVTLTNLDQFAPLLSAASKGSTTKRGRTDAAPDDQVAPTDPAYKAAEMAFQGKRIRVKTSLAAPKRRPPAGSREGKRSRRITAKERLGDASSEFATPVGPMIWKKPLFKSDVQSQAGHPTGGLRLTQAKNRDSDGKLINQRTFFRNLFAAFRWSPQRTHPFVEAATVPFQVAVRGRSLGLRKLKVSYKPKGEAGQGNYTTQLHWGEIAQEIKAARLAGSNATLFGPPPGKSDPFFLKLG